MVSPQPISPRVEEGPSACALAVVLEQAATDIRIAGLSLDSQTTRNLLHRQEIGSLHDLMLTQSMSRIATRRFNVYNVTPSRRPLAFGPRHFRGAQLIADEGA